MADVMLTALPGKDLPEGSPCDSPSQLSTCPGRHQCVTVTAVLHLCCSQPHCEVCLCLPGQEDQRHICPHPPACWYLQHDHHRGITIEGLITYMAARGCSNMHKQGQLASSSSVCKKPDTPADSVCHIVIHLHMHNAHLAAKIILEEPPAAVCYGCLHLLDPVALNFSRPCQDVLSNILSPMRSAQCEH